MPTATRKSDTDKVNELMDALDHPFKAEVAAVREIILNANSKILERVKWNAPSFYYNKDLAAFNLKKMEFAQLILIFPNGLVNDESGLLLGDWKDRREARFYDLADVQSKKAALEKVVNEWVQLIDQSSD